MKCDHCGLEYEPDHFIHEEAGGKALHFCCKGCQGVYHLLNESHLENFYTLKGSQTLSPPPNKLSDTAHFDTEAFKTRYVRQKDGLCEVSLVLEGIHCAACVWLNEKVLDRQPGVIEAHINFTTHKARILFDPEVIALSRIIETIRAIGYDAAPYDPALAEERADKERKEYYTRLIIAVFATMNVMWLAIARYLGYFTGMDPQLKEIIHFAEFLLATPTLFYSGWVFFRGAYYGLKNGFVTMDLLVATGATLTWLYSIYAVLIMHHEAYFDSVTMIITFVLIGKFLEVRAKKTAVDTLDSLIASAPAEVTRLKNGERERVTPEAICAGDLIEIVPGERIVFDGTVQSGEAALDTASLTGESVPRTVRAGDRILGGVLNTDGVLTIAVERDYAASTFKSIITLLEESLSNRPAIENTANKLSRYFSSTILAIAALTFLGWFFWLEAGFDRTLMVAVSVIVIACPCALALATPIATVVGTGAAAKRFILFKATRHLETMAKAKWLLLDKTGTLTHGKPQVIGHETYGGYDPARLLGLIEASDHPVAVGVAGFLQAQGIRAQAAPNVRAVAGRGLSAEGLLGGNAALMRDHGIETGDERGTHFFFAQNGVLAARFDLADTLKPEAKTAVEKLRKMGLQIALLTGDHEAAAQTVAAELGIQHVHAGLLPQDKAALVERYRTEGITVMAGDGLNDTVALAKADIAIALHSGADVAINVSDVVLLRDNISDLAAAFELSRRTYRTVKENIGLSFAYNALTIPLAVAGYVIPLIAALSMSLSSLIVVGNSFRIRWIK